MKKFDDIAKLFRSRALYISADQIARFGFFALVASFLVLFGFGGLMVWRNQRLLTDPPKVISGRRIEFHSGRLKKALEIIEARERGQ